VLVLTPTSTLASHPPCLLSSSWVHVVIKEDCWCVINLLKRKKKKTTWFQLKPILILFYYFPLVRNKTLSNIFWKHVLKCISLQRGEWSLLNLSVEQV
jgi:hypothetical protein